MRNLKIGLVLDDSLDKTDGVQQYVLSIGEWLRSQGHQVRYLVGETKRQDVGGVHSLSRNVRVRFNHNQMSMPLPTSTAALKRLLRTQDFDVLHIQLPYSPWLAHRIIRQADQRTAVFGTFHIVAHSRLVRLATKGLAVWTRSSLKRFDEIVSVSSAAADYARLTYGIHSDVIPNAVDYQRFQTAQPLPAYDDAVPTILFLGRLVERKGCLHLLKALDLLIRTHPDLPPFRLLICGKGPLQTKLEQFTGIHGLSPYVTFVGYVSEADKPRYYASADIAVFPSTGGESFGIVLIEALASGKPVVLAGDNSGYRSVLKDRPQLLFDPADTLQLSNLLATYLTDAAKRRAEAKWGNHYARQFDTATVGHELLARYEKALHKRRQQ
jgi:phosphatidyl-myo-inositol alpha-mannosyltransferase